MKCKSCGAELIEGSNFCFKCGSKVERELRCTQCGIKLPEGSVFCYKCGAKVGDSCEVKSESTEDNLLEEIFSSIEPTMNMLCHTLAIDDYFSANKNWLMWYNCKKGHVVFTDEDGLKRIEKEIPKFQWGYKYQNENLKRSKVYEAIGFNTKGIWLRSFLEPEVDFETFIEEFICINPINNMVRKYNISVNDSSFKEFFIYEDELYYICDPTGANDGKSSCVYVLKGGEQKQKLFEYKHKYSDVRICNLTVDANYYSFELNCDNDDDGIEYVKERSYNGCKVFSKETNECVVDLNLNTLFSNDWIEISKIDLLHKVFITGLTNGEKEKLNINGHNYIYAGRYLFGKSQGSIARLSNGNLNLYEGGKFFHWSLYNDSEQSFSAPNYWILIRIDREGNAIELSSGDGHGKTQHIVVSQKYVFCNYDAYEWVRLPRDFSSFTGQAKENPEAVKLNDIFKI